MQETRVWSLGEEHPLRGAWQPTAVFLPGESTWAEEPGGPQSMGPQIGGHDWSDLAQHSTPNISYLNRVTIYSLVFLLSQFWTSQLFQYDSVASLPAYRFLRRQVRWVWYSHLLKNFPQFVVINRVKNFCTVNETEVDIFWDSRAFSMIQRMLAIWSLVPLPYTDSCRSYTSMKLIFKTPMAISIRIKASSFFCFFLIGGWLLYNIVLVSAIQQHKSAEVHVCPLPPESCSPLPPTPPLYIVTEPWVELPVSRSKFPLAMCFTYRIIYVSIPFSQLIPPSLSSTESVSLFSMSKSNLSSMA